MAYTVRSKDNALQIGRAADQNESVDNDIYFNSLIGGGAGAMGVWQVWDPAPIVGYSVVPPDAVYRYMVIGKTVFLAMSEWWLGTRNAVTCTYTLPIQAANITHLGWYVTCPLSYNNSAVTCNTMGSIEVGGTVLNTFKDCNQGHWTLGNGSFATAHFQMFYEIA